MMRTNSTTFSIKFWQTGDAKLRQLFWGCERGTFAVEFAFIAPLLLLMLLAAYDLSTIVQSKMVMQSATRVGIQYGLIRRPVQGDMQQVENAVKASLPDDWLSSQAPYAPNVRASLVCECSLSGVTVCAAGCPSGEFRMSYLRIEVTKISKYIFQYPGLGENIVLHDKSLVRLQ